MSEFDAALEIAALQEQIKKLTVKDRVGNPVYGGPLNVGLSPSTRQTGPFMWMVDATRDLEFICPVPSYLTRIVECTLRVTPRAVRSATSVTNSPASTTSSAEGASPVNVSPHSHLHIWLSKVSSTPILVGTSVLSGTVGVPSATIVAAVGQHAHTETGAVTNWENTSGFPTITPASGTHTHAISGSQLVAIVANYSKWGTYNSSGNADATRAFDMLAIAGHPNDMYTTAAQGSSVSVAPASHTHEFDHTHPTAIGTTLVEGGSPSNITLEIDTGSGYVNVTAALGGPWNAAFEVDIRPYFLDSGIPPEPVSGNHKIRLGSDSVGTLEAVIDWYVIMRLPDSL